ncbi:MAG: YjjG family noncanonical pyrimidine nucleotidase [Reichenbachiella sp.]
MNKTYQSIFFDLDHTLWDYDANAKLTLLELFDQYELDAVGIESAEVFTRHFFEVNEDLWAKYNVGAIDKFYLRNERFRLVFEASGAIMKLVSQELFKSLNKSFLKTCSQKSKLMVGAKEILEDLHGRYPMYIITNGFEEVQSIKMESSGIHHYFEKIITSEKAGFKKPMAGIFTYAMKWCKADPEQSIMIGDNLNADIKGARDFGIDQVYYNPMGKTHDATVTHEITELLQLRKILLD